MKAFFYVLIIFCQITLARELTETSLDILTPKKGAEAKQEAFDQATEQATQRLTEELLGPERAARVWAQVRPKLLKNSERYVLFIKGSAPQDVNGNTKITVQMKLSPDNLEQLLRESGAMAGGTVRLLPLIMLQEHRGTRYVWWAEHSDDKNMPQAQEYFKRTMKQLSAQFKAKNVYVLDPSVASFRNSVPAAYRTENLRREDAMLLAQYLKADVVLSGKVDVVKLSSTSSSARIDNQLQLWQVRNGRAIADGIRSENVNSDAPKMVGTALEQVQGKLFGELAGKLGEAVAAGNLNLGVVKVTVVGNMNYQQHAEFKKLLSSVRDVRVLRERLWEPSRLTFEAETASTGNELAKTVERTKFPQFAVSVDGAQDQSLVLNVRPL